MLQLSRIHFMGIGHPAARLDPLTLNFRTSAGVMALSTILHLRNGGGKSSIIGLFFSLILPGKRDFLPEKTEKNRGLSSYLLEDEYGAIVSEWEQTTEDNKKPKKIILGCILQRSSNPSDSIRRWFFSFRPDETLSLEDLPLKGLSIPVNSILAFEQWVKHQSNRLPHLHWYSTRKPSEWNRFLAKNDIDTHLIKTQLLLNEREAGAGDIIQFNTQSDFSRFLFESVMPEKMLESVYQHTREFVQKHQSMPNVEQQRQQLEHVLSQLSLIIPACISLQIQKRIFQEKREEIIELYWHTLEKIEVIEREHIQLIQLMDVAKNGIETTEALDGSHTSRLTEITLASNLMRKVRYENRLTTLAVRKGRIIKTIEYYKAISAYNDIKQKQRILEQPSTAESRSYFDKLKSRIVYDLGELDLSVRQHQEMLTKNEVELAENQEKIITNEIEIHRKKENANKLLLQKKSLLITLPGLKREFLSDYGSIGAYKTHLATTISEQLSEQYLMGNNIKLLWYETVQHRTLVAKLTQQLRVRRMSLHFTEVRQQQQSKDRADLELHKALFHVIEDEPLDKLDSSLPKLLEGHRRRLNDSLILFADGLSDLHETIDDIDQFGLIVGPTVRDASHELRKANIEHTPTLVALAHRFTDANEASLYLNQHPSCLLGITFSNQELRDKARHTLDATNTLFGPVNLLLPYDAETNEPYCLQNLSEPTYNFKAAQQKIEESKRKLKRLENKMQRVKDDESNIVEFLNLWHTHVQVQTLLGSPASSMQRLQGRIVTLTERRDHVEKYLIDVENRYTLELSKATKKPKKLSQLLYRWFLLDRIEKEHPASIEELEEMIVAINDSLKQTEEGLAELKSRHLELLECANEVRQSTFDLNQEKLKLEDIDGEFPGEFRMTKHVPLETTYELKALLDISTQRLPRSQQVGILTGQLMELNKKFRESFDAQIARNVPQLRNRNKPNPKHYLVKIKSVDNEEKVFGRKLDTIKQQLLNHEVMPLEFEGIPLLELDSIKERLSAIKRKNLILNNEWTQDLDLKLIEIGNNKKTLDGLLSLKVRIIDAGNWLDLDFSSIPAPDLKNASDQASQQILLGSLHSEFKEVHVKKDKLNHCINRLHQVSIRHHLGKSLPTLASALLDVSDVMEPEGLRHIESEVRSRLTALTTCVRHYDAEKNDEIGLLTHLYIDAQNLLHKVASKSRITLTSTEEGVTSIETNILRIIVKRKQKSVQSRKDTCERYLNNILQSQEFPKNPMDMLVDLFYQPTADTNYQMELLKPKEGTDVEYISVDHIAFSGGEKLTAAVMLYCLICDMRQYYWGSNSPTNKHGGLLFLDNPFGAANFKPFINLQRAFAKQRNIQLVYATGSLEWDAMSEFEHWIKLRNSTIDQNTGYRTVCNEDNVTLTLLQGGKT